VTTDLYSHTAACVIDRSIAQIAIIAVAIVLTSRVAIMTFTISIIATDITTMYTSILANTFAIDTARQLAKIAVIAHAIVLTSRTPTHTSTIGLSVHHVTTIGAAIQCCV
jgi:hypothetical protein